MDAWPMATSQILAPQPSDSFSGYLAMPGPSSTTARFRLASGRPPGRREYDALRVALRVAGYDRSQYVAPLIRPEIIGDPPSVEAQSLPPAPPLPPEHRV